jgi:hypothetical protein
MDAEDSPTALTIAVIGDVQTRWALSGVVARLAELAVTDELLVMYGLDGRESTTGVGIVVAGLRRLLPRHALITIHVTQHEGSVQHDLDLIDDLMDVGSTPIAVASAAIMAGIVTGLCDRLSADRVVVMSDARDGEVALDEIWHRRTAVANRPVCHAA